MASSFFSPSQHTPKHRSKPQSNMKSIMRKLSVNTANKSSNDSARSSRQSLSPAPPSRTPGRHIEHIVTATANLEKAVRTPQEPPPAYTPAPDIVVTQPPSTTINTNTNTGAGASASASANTTTNTNTMPVSPQAVGADDAYSFLRTFDTIFLIDDSGSMAGSRWREAADALATITPICTSHDADGIDIFFLNQPDRDFHHGVQSASTVHEIFQSVKPGGGTPTGQRLRAILAPYLRSYEANPEATKPINIICITDGDAHDDVESPLIEAATKLDKLDAPSWQVGVQFFQIGNEPAATELLEYLDDQLGKTSDRPIRDIVDTVPYRGEEGARLSGDGVLKVVLGSVNRRLDRKRTQGLHK